MPDSQHPVLANDAALDCEALVRFLIQPLLDSPETLKLDCEVSSNKPRIWVRLAFEGDDKGRVFGRGGRNIQAIRTVLDAVGQLSGYSVHLDVYGGLSQNSHGDGGEESEKPQSRRPPRRRQPNSSR